LVDSASIRIRCGGWWQFISGDNLCWTGGFGTPGRQRRSCRTGEEWARISFELREGLDPTHAQAASAQAISVLAGVEAGTSTDYAVWAATLEGNLYERVNHDRTKARAAYVRALQKNPNSQAAAAGVARIDLQDAVTAVKIKEQQVLQQAPKTGN